MTEKCKLCRNPSEIVYLGVELCDKHWCELANDDDDPKKSDTIRKRLKLPPVPIHRGLTDTSIRRYMSTLKDKQQMKGWKRICLKQMVRALGLKYKKGTPKNELKLKILTALEKKRAKR